MRDKKVKTALNASIVIVNEFDHKPNTLWLDQGREFYNKRMQEWLNNNNILMYSTQNENKSVIAERFIKTLKAKIYKWITTNDSKIKFYLSYLNKLVDQYNKTYHHSVDRKYIDADFSALTEEIESSYKAPKFKMVIESELPSIKIISANVTLKISQEKYSLSILCWKLILGRIKLKN